MQYNIKKAREEAYYLLKVSRLSMEELLNRQGGYQLSLVHRKDTQGFQARLKDGVRALYDKNIEKRRAFEHEYTEYNDEFKNLYLYQIYRKLQKHTSGRVGRFRLMWLNPKSCYSFHTDINEPERFHLSLETNPYCFFLYKYSTGKCETYHIPADGYIYFVDAGKNHTFLNGGYTTRLHLLVTLMSPKYTGQEVEFKKIVE